MDSEWLKVHYALIVVPVQIYMKPVRVELVSFTSVEIKVAIQKSCEQSDELRARRYFYIKK